MSCACTQSMNFSTLCSEGITASPPSTSVHHGVEHAADGGDEITNVVGEIPVIDGEHANIVVDDDEARKCTVPTLSSPA